MDFEGKESKEGKEWSEVGEEMGDEEAVFTYEGLFNTKNQRVEELLKNEADPTPCEEDDSENAQAVPESYKTNSRKEELVIEYVNNFVRQFEALFPERPRLFVTPRNEYGVPKVVCSTLRPTQLPNKQLYNAGQCAEFVANYMQYEPLSNPVEPPEIFPSPTFSLKNQIGDCFDISNILCSFLIGSGYDAYIVHGYAPRDITLLNRTCQACPLLQTRDSNTWDLQKEGEKEEIELVDLRDPSEIAASQENRQGEEKVDEESQEGKHAEITEQGSDEAKVSENAVQEAGEGSATANAASSESTDVAQASTIEDAANPAAGAEEKENGTNQGGQPSAEQSAQNGGEKAADGGAAQSKASASDADPYDIEVAGVKASRFQEWIKSYEKCESKAAEDASCLQEESETQDEPDHLQGRRVHSWVLVRAGKRGVDQSFFIEPTTGQLYHLLGSPYLGVETVWNNKNVWVNMQQNAERPMAISYNLEMEECWEFVFVNEAPDTAAESRDGADDDAAALINSGRSNEEIKVKEAILDLPASWPSKLVLSREDMKRMYNTTGQRTQLFFKSKLESYAKHLHPHGLVKRAVSYRDVGRTLPIQVLEYFADRRDKLVLRRRYPLEGRVVECFAEGRASGLKQINEVIGKSRDIEFYEGARLDGLMCRNEIMGEMIEENFVNRDDHLQKRVIDLQVISEDAPVPAQVTASRGRSEEKSKAGDSVLKNTMTLPRANQGGDLSILKMKQVYARNKAVKEADDDIAVRSFYVSNAFISVMYHYASGKISRSSRMFYKDPSKKHEVKLSSAFAAALRPSQVDEEFQNHLTAEKDCYQSVRDTEREVQEILALRKREEAAIVIEKSIFEIAREKSKEEAKQQQIGTEPEQKNELHVDYLTPFLQHITNLGRIRRDEAEQARDACLKSLKERLLERANIIQCRLDEENAQLAKKQAAFQRSRDHVDGADQEFERFCSEAMFRIQILEQRLARHEESALSVYANLDQRLRSDPRIAVLYAGK